VASGRPGWRLCRVSGAREVPRSPRRPREASVRLTGPSGPLGLPSPKPTTHIPDRRRARGSLVFPAPSWPFAVAGWAPEGIPPTAAPTEAGAGDPHDLGVHFEAPSRALVPPRGRSSSREIRSAPPPTWSVCVHSREQAPLGPTPPGARRVPPSWFLTTSTVCSTHGPAGLLRPAAGQGFVAFRSRRSRSRHPSVKASFHADAGGGPPCDLPATRVHTLRRVSLVGSRCPITGVRCPLAVAGMVRSSAAAEADAGSRSRRTGSRGATPTRPPPRGRPSGAARWHLPPSRLR
jgi:hypothetical protein